MSREDIPWLSLMILLLIGGLLVGQRLLSPAETVPELGTPESAEASFRAWFWEHRHLDLAVQVAILFVGTLGVAVLLPKEGESG